MMGLRNNDLKKTNKLIDFFLFGANLTSGEENRVMPVGNRRRVTEEVKEILNKYIAICFQGILSPSTSPLSVLLFSQRRVIAQSTKNN